MVVRFGRNHNLRRGRWRGCCGKAREEGPGETGAAHFLEHTLFKGTKTRGVGETDMAIENLGATLNASTGPDYARFYTCAQSEHAADALGIVADVVRNATLPETEVERERQVIRDELAQRDSDAGSLSIDRLYGVAFATHPETACPLTLEHAALLKIMEKQGPRNSANEGSTNIGDAIAWALHVLQQAPTRRKVLVLLTDGENDVPENASKPSSWASSACPAPRAGCG